ncbi:MAG: hypothetical protein JJV98_13875 [Desulfosarcina sp.]|nr:hypothetical protein [Desulfobacterales bacterium]
MALPDSKNDIRVLSPRELLAKTESDTGPLRLRTSRDVLPGGYMMAMAPVLVDWKASRIQGDDPFVILRNVNYGGNPIERTTVLQSVHVPLAGIRFAEFILVPPRHMGIHAPVQHAQLRFVFQPEHHPTLLSLAGTRTGTDSRFPDLVLSWESWSPPHVHYNFVKGMDSSAYRLSLRAYAGPQRFLEEVLHERGWYAFRLSLPGGDAGLIELLKVILALGDGAGRHTLSRMMEEGEEDWLEHAPPDMADPPTRRLWQLLKDHIRQSKDYGDPLLQFSSEEETYNTMVHSCATLARYTILVAAHRLVNRGHTDGLNLDHLPEAVLGQPEAWMREAAHAKLGGIFMRGPLAMTYAMRHPETLPEKIPGLLAKAGLIERRDGKPWKVHYTHRGTRPYDATGVRAVDVGASEG